MEEVVKAQNTKDKIIECITYFFIYSFLGWLIETIYALFVHGFFVKRGFLYGPFCPMYGFGAVLLLQITKKIYKKPLLKFIIAIITFTIFEYIVSLTLEMLFGLRWWDYSRDFLNIQGRISLTYSIFWGVIGLILLEKLHPYIQDKIQNITKGNTNNIQKIFCFILIAILILDTIFSVYKYVQIDFMLI